MNNRTKQLIIMSFLLAGAVLLTATAVSLGDDDADQETASDSSISPAVDSLNLPVAHDSIYALINTGFLTVKPLVAGACFDCHTDQTDYPWYQSIPIIGGWIEGHVREGRGELDMTNGFPFATRLSPANSLAKIRHEIEDGEMPLWSYRLMHSSARLSDAEKDSIFAWLEESLGWLESVGEVPTKRSGGEKDED